MMCYIFCIVNEIKLLLEIEGIIKHTLIVYLKMKKIIFSGFSANPKYFILA